MAEGIAKVFGNTKLCSGKIKVDGIIVHGGIC
jgi:hypothetical protein